MTFDNNCVRCLEVKKSLDMFESPVTDTNIYDNYAWEIRQRNPDMSDLLIKRLMPLSVWNILPEITANPSLQLPVGMTLANVVFADPQWTGPLRCQTQRLGFYKISCSLSYAGSWKWIILCLYLVTWDGHQNFEKDWLMNLWCWTRPT